MADELAVAAKCTDEADPVLESGTAEVTEATQHASVVTQLHSANEPVEADM